MNPETSFTSFVGMLAGARSTKSAFAPVTPLHVPELVVLARGFLAIVVLIFSATSALAQSTKLPNPADPEAAVSVLKFESAFSDYQAFREQKSNSWKQVNKEVADNPGMGSMGSMKDMQGKTMPGIDSKTAEQTKGKEGGDGHDMGSMKDMPGMDKQATAAPKNKESLAAHETEPMKDMPGKTEPGMDSKTADEPVKRKNADEMAMAKPDGAPGPVANAQTAGITGTGIVLGVDKANGTVKLAHEPIAALGWPKMTMFFRLKESALADQVKEGDRVEFTLEKSASGYVISGWQKSAASHDMKQIKKNKGSR